MRSPLLIALLLIPLLAHAQPPFGGPPPEAKQACQGQAEGSSCSFQAPHGRIDGSCRQVPEGNVCVPAGGGMHPAGGMPGQPPRTGDMRPGNEPMGLQQRPPRVDIAATPANATPVSSRIPDTNQGSCFDADGVIPCPAPGQPWYGQDAQYAGAAPSYQDNGDGTLSDRVTGLMWQQGHNEQRLDWYAARQDCADLRLGGHADWRLPSIRELFSISDFRGAAGQRPYLNEVFAIRAPQSISQTDLFASSHRPEMMGQTWSATLYAGQHWDQPGMEAAFFMNFLDGRIKQAPTRGREGLFHRCVRGAPWGDNAFHDNGDGSISDQASGLTWQQRDDGRTRDWPAALAYCESLSQAGHADWRLPNVKELQSIVDYRRPQPALDTRYLQLSDPKAWFWSSTSLGDNIRQATYVCFGKCTSVEGIDVHGAGAMRSDPKQGPVGSAQAQGGQHDEIRVNNLVRCVR
ncbi:Lcl C-terminal domain-containing protein [Pseudomonas sp. BMS12]|uniref:Lcl C-terminal domain-containing protein n=1 Tax=Pseudomonas sp. BMS12 TaxID=1796033 RepID=UPI00083AEA49|nr:DUF1566 domain-containing protein [Pseudomonas sp. BMS12]